MVCLSLFQTPGCQPPFNQRLNPRIQPLVSGQTEINGHPSWKITIAFEPKVVGVFASDSDFPHLFLFDVYFICGSNSRKNFPGEKTNSTQLLWKNTVVVSCVVLESGDQPITRQMHFMTCNQGQPKEGSTNPMTGEQRKKNGELLNHLEVVAPIISTPSITFYDSD